MSQNRKERSLSCWICFNVFKWMSSIKGVVQCKDRRVKNRGFHCVITATDALIMISQEYNMTVSFQRIINSKLVDLCLENMAVNKFLLVFKH